jgi:hypothetical protein
MKSGRAFLSDFTTSNETIGLQRAGYRRRQFDSNVAGFCFGVKLAVSRNRLAAE